MKTILAVVIMACLCGCKTAPPTPARGVRLEVHGWAIDGREYDYYFIDGVHCGAAYGPDYDGEWRAFVYGPEYPTRVFVGEEDAVNFVEKTCKVTEPVFNKHGIHSIR